MNPSPEQVAAEEAAEREAEAFVAEQWAAADAWLDAEWPHATDGERAVARSIWTERSRQAESAAALADESRLEGDARLVHQQCMAVFAMAIQLAEVHRVFANMIVEAPGAVPLEVTGPGSAATMEVLGDILNNMDAVTDEDEWMTPIFEQAHARWTARSSTDARGVPDTKGGSDV